MNYILYKFLDFFFSIPLVRSIIRFYFNSLRSVSDKLTDKKDKKVIIPSKDFTDTQYQEYLKYANVKELEYDRIGNKTTSILTATRTLIPNIEEEYRYEDDVFTYTNDL